MNVGRLAQKAFVTKDPGGKLLTNAFTGYKLTKTANIGLAIGGVGVGAGMGAAQWGAYSVGIGSRARAEQMGTIAYSGNSPELLYDGRANINKMTGQYDLGATGDIVLAMNAQRKK